LPSARPHGGRQHGRLPARQTRHQQRHLVVGERPELQHGRGAGAAQLADHPRQRVARPRLVAAVGGHQQDAPPGDCVGEEGDQVEGCELSRGWSLTIIERMI
jgi:hypothetical protein